MRKAYGAGLVLAAGIAAATSAQIDGQNVGAGLPLWAVQNSPTAFGNATGGGQDSAGGSELDGLWGNISGSTLNLSISGNLEANFNKLWIFFDATPGGENTLDATNVDGGFNEIQNMAGMTFDPGFTPDHGIRVEIGAGFYGINFFDLVDDTAGSIWGGGGPADLPAGPRTGGFGVTHGWDNSNILGVDGSSAAGALTATTGIEFSIDMLTAFGVDPASVGVMAMISNGGGDFLSNQILPGVDSTANLGDPSMVDFRQFSGSYAVIPSPGAGALLALGGLAATRRRRV